MELEIFDDVPELKGTGEEAIKTFEKPTLIPLDFGKEKTILVSSLIHGNEQAGFNATIDFLKNRRKDFPFNIVFFIVNVKAAKRTPAFHNRRLEGQEDFNRIWHEDSQVQLVKEFNKAIKKYNIIGGIDLHTNSGKNKPYMICTLIREDITEFVNSFGLDIVCFDTKPTTFINYLAKKGVTIAAAECGQNRTRESTENAKEILMKTLNFFSDKISGKEIKPEKQRIYKIFAAVKVKDVHFSTDGKPARLMIRPDIENLNFQKACKGELLGRTISEKIPLTVDDEKTEDWLELKNGKISLKQEAVILMATKDRHNIEKSVLLYLAKEYDQK